MKKTSLKNDTQVARFYRYTQTGVVFFQFFFLAFPTFDSCCGSGTGKRYWQVPSTLRDVAGRQVGINQRMCVSFFSLFSLFLLLSRERGMDCRWKTSARSDRQVQTRSDKFLVLQDSNKAEVDKWPNIRPSPLVSLFFIRSLSLFFNPFVFQFLVPTSKIFLL